MLFTHELHIISIWSLLIVSQNCGLTLLKDCGGQSSFQVTVKKNLKVGLNILLTYEKERLLLQKDRRTGNNCKQSLPIVLVNSCSNSSAIDKSLNLAIKKINALSVYNHNNSFL